MQAPFRHSVELPAGLSDRSLATFDENGNKTAPSHLRGHQRSGNAIPHSSVYLLT